MTHADIKQSKAAGNSDWEILAQMIAAGCEYPDAVYRVSAALTMQPYERRRMERDYDECC
jgi:hypothetical protein